MTKPECAVEICAKLSRKGSLYCEAHYCRLRRTGSLALRDGSLEIRTRLSSEVCIVSGCDKPSKSSRNLCAMHVTRVKRHGSPHIVIAPADRKVRRGPDSPGWLPDDVVDYRTIHMRLRRIIGSARTMQCADCGERAAVHWSYDHQDPDERLTPEGVPYSIRPSHYQPRCASCHKFFDHAFLRREAVRRALADLVSAAEAAGNAVAAEFARSHLETEWPRFTIHTAADSGFTAYPTCDGGWAFETPEGAVA